MGLVGSDHLLKIATHVIVQRISRSVMNERVEYGRCAATVMIDFVE
jgi:hypothetical protein